MYTSNDNMNRYIHTFGIWLAWTCWDSRPSSRGACDASNTTTSLASLRVMTVIR